MPVTVGSCFHAVLSLAALHTILQSDKNKLAFKCCCGEVFSAARRTKTSNSKRVGEDSILLLDRDCLRSQVA